jgi:hypothetical protein
MRKWLKGKLKKILILRDSTFLLPRAVTGTDEKGCRAAAGGLELRAGALSSSD